MGKSKKKTPEQPAAQPPSQIIIIEQPERQKAGRREFWLTPDRIKLFGMLLERGGTDADACEQMGLSKARFYTYLQTGRAMKGLEAMPKVAPEPGEKRELCLEFLEVVTRARATARLRAAETITRAIEGAESGKRTVTTLREIRLDSENKPYVYERETIVEEIYKTAPDWRAAIEFLARRDKPNWSERIEIQAVPFEEKVIHMIRAGEVDYDTLMGQFNDPVLVSSWFELAGVDPLK